MVKISTRILSSALALMTVFSVFSATVYAKENENQQSSASENSLWADGNSSIDSADENALDVIRWFSESDQGKGLTDIGSVSDHYYLFLPTTADLNNLTLWHSFSENPVVNDVELVSGEATSVFSAQGDYTLAVGSANYTLTVMQSKNIGSIYIATESGNMEYIHADKENKESGDILVVQADGTVDYDKALDQIKGRGNTTWTNIEKKPYNIKLDKKASLLGMDESKKWCLLANGQDHSLIRNKIAFDLADEMGMEFTPDSQYVDLYLNGEYSGVYQLSEKVEIGDNNLVKVNDLEGQTEDLNDADLDSYKYHNGGTRKGTEKYYEIPNNPEDITGGYLMEYEVESKYAGEPCGFVTTRGQYVVLKGPEIASKEQVEYISTFVQEMEDALYSATGYNSLGKHYTEYIDSQSAALMYLIQEYAVNIDSGITSCFFYKESDLLGDGKIHAGPAWDFDVSFGNLENEKDGVSMKSTNKWFAKIAKQYGNGQNTIFAQLCTHDDFWNVVKEAYVSELKPALEILNNEECVSSDFIKSVPQYRIELEDSVAMNFARWRIEDNLLVKSAGKTYDSQMNYLVKFLTNRAKFLDDGFLGDPSTDTDEPNEEFVVYFNNALDWDSVYIYYWGGNSQTTWPGQPMTDLGNGVYKFDLGTVNISEDDSVNIIFNNGYGNGRQTVNLSPENGYIFTPNSEYTKTDKDGEATKYYYDGEWEEYVSVDIQLLLGDVDGDGKITSIDSLFVMRSAIGYDTLTNTEKLVADVDSNEKVNSFDALYILRYVAGYESDYPINKFFTVKQ